MHNLVEHPSGNPRIAKEQLDKNLEIIATYVEFDHYNVWIPAIAFQQDAGSTIPMTVLNGSVPAREFFKGKNYEAMYAFRKPSMWINGIVTVRPHFSRDPNEPVGSVDYVVAVGVKSIDEGASFNPHPFNFPYVKTVPNVGEQWLIDRIPETSGNPTDSIIVGFSTAAISVGFSRRGTDGRDTAALHLYLLGMEVFYRELFVNVGLPNTSQRSTKGSLEV